MSLTLTTSVRFYGLSPIAVLMVCGNALHFGDYSFCNIKNFSLGYSVSTCKNRKVLWFLSKKLLRCSVGHHDELLLLLGKLSSHSTEFQTLTVSTASFFHNIFQYKNVFILHCCHSRRESSPDRRLAHVTIRNTTH